MNWVFTGIGQHDDGAQGAPARPYRCLVDRDEDANWLILWTWLDTNTTQRVLIAAEHAAACAWLTFLFTDPTPVGDLAPTHSPAD